MATKKDLQNQEVKDRLSLFQAEQAITQRRQKIGYAIIAIVGSITLLIVTGDPVGILGLFGFHGIRYEQRGVYAECSKGANINLAACRPKVSVADRNWRDLVRGEGKTAPFSLYSEEE